MFFFSIFIYETPTCNRTCSDNRMCWVRSICLCCMFLNVTIFILSIIFLLYAPFENWDFRTKRMLLNCALNVFYKLQTHFPLISYFFFAYFNHLCESRFKYIAWNLPISKARYKPINLGETESGVYFPIISNIIFMFYCFNYLSAKKESLQCIFALKKLCVILLFV